MTTPKRTPTPATMVPAHWSAAQALAVFEFVDELRDQIWRVHGVRIQTALKKDRGITCDPRQMPLDLRGDDDF